MRSMRRGKVSAADRTGREVRGDGLDAELDFLSRQTAQGQAFLSFQAEYRATVWSLHWILMASSIRSIDTGIELMADSFLFS